MVAAIWSVPAPDAGSLVIQELRRQGYRLPATLYSSVFGQVLDSGRWERVPAPVEAGIDLPQILALDQANTTAKALGRGQWCHPDLLPIPLFSTGRAARALVDGWFEPRSTGLEVGHLDRLCALKFSNEARAIIGGAIASSFAGRNDFERRVGLFTPGVVGRLMWANLLDGEGIAETLQSNPAQQATWRAACAEGLAWQLEQDTPQAKGWKLTARL